MRSVESLRQRTGRNFPICGFTLLWLPSLVTAAEPATGSLDGAAGQRSRLPTPEQILEEDSSPRTPPPAATHPAERMTAQEKARHRTTYYIRPHSTTGPAGDPDKPELPVGRDIRIPDEGRVHVPLGTRVHYRANPPASGPHWSDKGPPKAPADPGFYRRPLHPEQWVHNLEHGHVVILYDCGGRCPDELLDDLRALIRAVPPGRREPDGRQLLITPYRGLTHPLMIVAWDVQMSLDDFDRDALIAFYKRHVDRAPESPGNGAPMHRPQ